MLVLSFIITWVIFCILAGVLANNKHRNEFGWVVLVLLFSPMVILILLALQPLPAPVVEDGATIAERIAARKAAYEQAQAERIAFEKSPAGIAQDKAARRFARIGVVCVLLAVVGLSVLTIVRDPLDNGGKSRVFTDNKSVTVAIPRR